MKILALDSTAKICTAALTCDRELVSIETLDAGMTHSETLLPIIERLLRDAKWKVSDIDMFALSAGPGSFTGVRIGAATVKGLSFDRKRPCVALSSLHALSYNCIDCEGIVVSSMDARRGQVYCAVFRVKDGCVERISDDMAIAVTDLCDICEKYTDDKIYLVGDGALLVFAELEKRNSALDYEYSSERAGQNAYSVALLGYDTYQKGESVSDTDLRPSYLRLAQAERERLEKINKEK